MKTSALIDFKASVKMADALNPELMNIFVDPADSKLYGKKNDGTVVQLSGSSGVQSIQVLLGGGSFTHAYNIPLGPSTNINYNATIGIAFDAFMATLDSAIAAFAPKLGIFVWQTRYVASIPATGATMSDQNVHSSWDIGYTFRVQPKFSNAPTGAVDGVTQNLTSITINPLAAPRLTSGGINPPSWTGAYTTTTGAAITMNVFVEGQTITLIK